MRWLGAKGTTYIAVALSALGFFVIFLGWNGAAEKDFVAGQVPYLLSAGFTGLGLILAGLALAVVESRRRDTARLLAKLEALIAERGGVPTEDPVTEEIQAVGRSRRKGRSA